MSDGVSRDDLRAAVASGVLDEAQASKLMILSDQRQGYRANMIGDDEPFELFKGFAEIFVTVGLGLLMAGFIGLTALFGDAVLIPIVGLGLRGGLNINQAEVLRSYSVGNQAQPTKDYTFHLSWNAAFLIDLNLFRNAYLTAELQLTGKQFGVTEKPLPSTTVTYRERLSYLEVPLSFKYEFGNRLFAPYLRVGGIAGRLLSARKTDLLSNVSSEMTNIDLEATPIDISSQRVPFEWNAFVGAGLGIKTGFDRVFVEVRYRRGLYNMVRTGSRFDIPELQHNLYQIDDDFMLHGMEVSIGYTH